MLPSFPPYRSLSVAPVVAAILALAALLLAGVGPAHASESVLVNANADGDTPLAGGTVRASACARHGVGAGAALRQTNGTLEEPTNAAGVTLLQFKRLPRCLIVDVAGGQANGARLPGSFRAEAHNHSGGVMSVLVTPVSTLTYAARREHPSLNPGGAKRVVDRLLGIPRVFNDIDLDADDGPFDGDTYLAAVQRAGSVAKLNQSLLRTAQGHGRHTFRAQHARASQVVDVDGWWKDLDVTKMVTDGLKDFGLSILTNAAASGGKWVLGRLLDEWGLKDVKDFLLPKSDTEKLLEMVQELTIRVNTLQKTADTILKEVLNSRFDNAVSPATSLLSRIDQAQLDIQNLLKLPDNDPGRMGTTKDILEKIRGMDDDRNLLNFLLTRAGPVGEGILITASKKAAAQDRWFTAKDSQDVVDVYKYFAIYQLRLANLLVEYWNTRSCNNTPVPANCLSANDDPAEGRPVSEGHRRAGKAAQAATARRNVHRPHHDEDVADGVMAAQRTRRPQLDLVLAAAALHHSEADLHRLVRVPLPPPAQDELAAPGARPLDRLANAHRGRLQEPDRRLGG